MSRTCRVWVLVSLVTAAAVARALAGGEPPAPPAPVIAGADVKARVASAQAMKKTDVPGLIRALSALGASPKTTKDADRDFLLQYALQERDRAPRMIALEALSRLDKKGACAWLKTKADGKDTLATVVSLEALACLGAKEEAALAIGLIESEDELIAVAAANAAGRLGDAGDLEAIAENGLTHPSDHITNHAAWAVQDIMKKQKDAAKYFEKWAAKKSDPKSIRAQATVALLQDKLADPHPWGDTLTASKDLLAKAPASIEIQCGSEEYKKRVGAALEWLKTNMPAAELMIRAAARRIDVPGKQPDGWVDTTEEVIQVPLTWATQAPHKLALQLFEMGTVVWEKRVGEPCKAHRGWEPALFDAYDVCVISKLYDAGPGGMTRATFMKEQVEKHPWGSQ